VASKQLKGTETDAEELLDAVDQNLDRVKTLYEQYFLGIQKQAPAFLHADVERKLRDLAQMQLRNTRLRYRLATIQQKFGSYNAYWRRTLRQIENGTYARQLSKIGRDAIRSGAEIPEEILAAMPKMMRDRVIRDREAALLLAHRRQAEQEPEPPAADDDFVAMIKEPTDVRRKLKSTDGAHLLNNEEDFDIDAFFAEVEQQDEKPRPPTPARGRQTRQPANRGRTTSAPPAYDDPERPRPITRNDLKRAATEPATPAARSGSQPNIRPALTQTQPMARVAMPPPVPGRAAPPPVPRRAETHEESTEPNAQIPTRPVVPAPVSSMASQASRPNPIAPGAAAQRGPVPVESMAGPFPREKLPTPLGGIPAIPKPGVPRPTGAIPTIPKPTETQAMPSIARPPIPRPGTGAQPAIPRPPTGQQPPIPRPGTGAHPAIPKPAETQALPTVARTTPAMGVPRVGEPAVIVTKTPAAGLPAVGTRTPAAGVPTRTGTGPRPAMPPAQKPPPGMTDADVNALYAKYVKAKEMVGEKIGPGEHNKLLKTINAQAPKIMEQYKAKGVDFSVVVKDNQVIIRAKPKT
jgi:hypothetical protein